MIRIVTSSRVLVPKKGLRDSYLAALSIAQTDHKLRQSTIRSKHQCSKNRAMYRIHEHFRICIQLSPTTT